MVHPVFQELLAEINKYGGQIKPTWGVPVAEIQKGIQHGVRKVNVDTDTRLAVTAAIRKFFVEHPEKFDPREYLAVGRTGNKDMIAARMIAFGQAGHATDFS
jgi:fructose-bisphosphate aldolase class II